MQETGILMFTRLPLKFEKIKAKKLQIFQKQLQIKKKAKNVRFLRKFIYTKFFLIFKRKKAVNF